MFSTDSRILRVKTESMFCCCLFFVVADLFVCMFICFFFRLTCAASPLSFNALFRFEVHLTLLVFTALFSSVAVSLRLPFER